jgi:hypothetical protein
LKIVILSTMEIMVTGKASGWTTLEANFSLLQRVHVGYATHPMANGGLYPEGNSAMA